MRLTTLHRILIASGVLLGILFALWSAHQFTKTDDIVHVVIASLSGITSVALAIYLKRFTARVRAESTPAPTHAESSDANSTG
jgi:dolichyl-phosphate-mannose--protein O-mannosyl transferase